MRGPQRNEAVSKGAVKYRLPITSATFCPTCGRGAPTIVTFGDQLVVTIPSCYAHAHAKIGDRDGVTVVRNDDHATAASGQLDIEDCTSTHLLATLSVKWADGRTVDAAIDTPLTPPADAPPPAPGSRD